ncbi:MAG: hypothetical protein ABI603_00450 [Acidobacteriota bacterium]
MQKPDTTQTRPRGTGATAGCCTDQRCESGLRNNYYEGKRVTPDTFRTEQRYLNERRRLLNRAIHGWGVVYGYPIGVTAARAGQRSGSTGRLDVGAGLALDQCGRELLETGRQLTIDDLIVLDDKLHTTTLGDLLGVPQTSIRSQKAKDPAKKICALITAHYAEQSIDAVTLTDACRCERREWDHVCETVRYTLRIVSCDDCCRDWECELCCSCGHGACQPSRRVPVEDDPGHPRPSDPKSEVGQPHVTQPGTVSTALPSTMPEAPPTPGTACETLPFRRGGGQCVCEHLTSLAPGEECDFVLCEMDDPCGRMVRVDVRHGVPLACVRLDSDSCQDWCIAEVVDACGPRRLVKRNDLLFDLLRGCDLTRIVEIGWPWHRALDPIPFAEFQAAFGTRGYDQDEYVTRDFWIRFSKPVREETVRPDCFAMLIISGEREGKWWQAMRVPIRRVVLFDPESGDPAGHVRGARIVVDGGWAEDALWGRGSVFHGHTRVELEVRGHFIIDCNGQPIDADTVGLAPVPTGSGSPGGLFLSTFQVAPRDEHQRQAANRNDRAKGAVS